MGLFSSRPVGRAGAPHPPGARSGAGGGLGPAGADVWLLQPLLCCSARAGGQRAAGHSQRGGTGWDGMGWDGCLQGLLQALGTPAGLHRGFTKQWSEDPLSPARWQPWHDPKVPPTQPRPNGSRGLGGLCRRAPRSGQWVPGSRLCVHGWVFFFLNEE